jgi:hypothetical protein
MNRFETYVIASGLLLLVFQGLLTFYLVRAIRRLTPLQQRVSHFGDALSLLTETADAGFRAVAVEVERLGARAIRQPASRATTARVARASQRGRSIQEIAAAEQVSEGEVRLRLHLADHGTAGDTPRDRKRTTQLGPAGAPEPPAEPPSDASAPEPAAQLRPRSTSPVRSKPHGSLRA